MSWRAITVDVLKVETYQRSGRQKDWCNKVEYRYLVGNFYHYSRNISASIISSAGCDKNRAIVDGAAASMLSRKKTIAYYNPKKVSESILIKEGLDILDYIYLFSAIALLLAGIWEFRQSHKD
jgi:hypothetical protein